MNVLDFRCDYVHNTDTNTPTCVISVWDGSMYVASQRLRVADVNDLFPRIRSFVFYWSRLYYDEPELTFDISVPGKPQQLTLPGVDNATLMVIDLTIPAPQA